MMKRLVSIGIIVSFLITSIMAPPQGYAQESFNLPLPGTMVNLSPAFAPLLIKGLKVHPDNPLLFDFILDTGRSGLNIHSLEFETQSQKLIKYFLASLTIKEDDQWVNLSPYEKDKIIPEELGQTEFGRDMLAQDYILKQLTSSLIYPEAKLGQEFWDRVYAKARVMYGTSQIPVNTFNKVWIVADKAKVLERNNAAYIIGAHLKVMLEEDYLALSHHSEKSHLIASQIIKQIILPELEKEVNQGENFANLRQIFYSMILATWYKEALKNAFLNQVYANKNKISGLSFHNLKENKSYKNLKQTMSSPNAFGRIDRHSQLFVGDPSYIYQQYLKAYKKGVFNFIKEDVDAASKQRIPRKYFSGGLVPDLGLNKQILQRASYATPLEAKSSQRTDGSFAMVSANMAQSASVLPTAASSEVVKKFTLTKANLAMRSKFFRSEEARATVRERRDDGKSRDVERRKARQYSKRRRMQDEMTTSMLRAHWFNQMAKLKVPRFVSPERKFMFGFPLIAPTAITHLDNNCNGESCIALLSPTISRDLTIKSRTQIFIFLPGDINELKRVFKLKSAENILRFARFKKDAGRSLLGIGGSVPKEITGFPYIDATHRELIRLNLSRKFTTMVNTSRAHSVEEAIILAAVGVQTIRTPYLKIEIRGNDLMTKNDDILKVVKLLISLNKQLKLIPLIGKGISREMLEDLLNKPQVIALRIEATKPGSNNGLGTPTDKEQIQRAIHWAREIRPDAQLIAECGIGKPEDAKEAMAMGFNAVLVNAAITQSIDPVATAVAFSNAVGGSTKVVALTSVNKRSVNNSLHVSKAMAASVLTPGGIDLNAKHLGLDVENENDNFKMKLNLAMIAEFKRGNFSGIVPIIIRITMITSPLTSLGME